MPKVQKEPASVLTPGRWGWNDETQSLEFISFNSTAEDILKKRKKNKITSIDAPKLPESVIAGRAKKTVGPALLNAYKPSAKRTQRDSVTIEDVKKVALSLLLEEETLSVPRCFMTLLTNRELDEFLATLLLYLSCYFERTALEMKPKPLMAEQSVSEKQVMAETVAKVELAQKQLAFCYSSLVLGLGLAQQHHMACGRSRVSATYKDRQMYECLYSFLCLVAWVTFGRKDLRLIQKEVGRLLRSDTFNPALRSRAEEQAAQGPPTQDPSSAERSREPHGVSEHRRSQKRPALCRIVTQRSPVMVSLLPLPKEGSPHLFHSGRPRREPQARPCHTGALMAELRQRLLSFRFGILGKPLSQFSSTTLMPQGAEKESEEGEEDEEDEEEEGGRAGGPPGAALGSKHSFTAQRSGSATDGRHASATRTNTSTSRATTEGGATDVE